jgi:hypothetical protein
MAEKSVGVFEREVRDTVIKSSLTGVAATALAVTVFSPAGFGGMVGTSLASGFGGAPSSAENPYANLPAYPAPLSVEEVSDIRGQLASVSASMEITRAATDARIERVRSVAMSNGLVAFSSAAPPSEVQAPRLAHAAPLAAPVRVAEAIAPAAEAPAELRLTLSDPVAVLAPVNAPSLEASMMPVSYTVGGGSDYSVPGHLSHLELAELMFADERY